MVNISIFVTVCAIIVIFKDQKVGNLSSFKVRLKSQRVLSESTRDFRFERVDGKGVDFIPGQFYRFTFEDEKGLFERSYSLCNNEPCSSSNLRSQNLDLVISKVDEGRATKLLFQENSNISASVLGPYGRLILPEVLPERLFLIATSVGMAPFIPILNQLHNVLTDGKLKVHFLYGVRDESEFIYGQWLCDFAEKHEDFELSVCYSREASKHQYATNGYVQERLKQLLPNPATDHFLLCGNPHMIDEVNLDLKKSGCKVKQIVREKYVFAKDKKAIKTAALSTEDRKLLAEKMAKYQK